MTFAAAARIAARLAATLGWSPDVFWASTPADLRTALGLVALACGQIFVLAWWVPGRQPRAGSGAS